MKDKKTQVITFRTEEWVKTALEETAEYNKWSLAQTVNQILINYLINPQPGKITIPGKELIKAAKEIRQEGIEKGVEIEIQIKQFEGEEASKYLSYTIIECGGLGAIEGDHIKGMTDEEILNIP